jgi:hypothetical protein
MGRPLGLPKEVHRSLIVSYCVTCFRLRQRCAASMPAAEPASVPAAHGAVPAAHGAVPEVEPLTTHETMPDMDTVMVDVVSVEERPNSCMAMMEAAVRRRTAPTPAMMLSIWPAMHLIGDGDIVDGDLQASRRAHRYGVGRD